MMLSTFRIIRTSVRGSGLQAFASQFADAEIAVSTQWISGGVTGSRQYSITSSVAQAGEEKTVKKATKKVTAKETIVTGNYITKVNLSRVIAETHELTLAKSSRIIDTIINTISDSLVEQKGFRLSGLGTFKTIPTKARTGRNPRTGEALSIPMSRRVRFTPVRKLKDRVKPTVA